MHEDRELFIRDLSIDWDKIGPRSYLRDIPAIAEADCLAFSAPVTFFVGENGSGKSTLPEAIAIASGFNPEGGARNYRFSTYDSHSELCDALRLGGHGQLPHHQNVHQQPPAGAEKAAGRIKSFQAY